GAWPVSASSRSGSCARGCPGGPVVTIQSDRRAEVLMRGGRRAGTRVWIALALGAVAAPAVVAVAPRAGAAPPLGATALRAAYLANPLGIDDTHPSLSWQLDSQTDGARQTAYRILVASAPSRLTPGHADVWDSGRVASSTSVGTAYAGPALQSTHRYYWTV